MVSLTEPPKKHSDPLDVNNINMDGEMAKEHLAKDTDTFDVRNDR